ncbi:hypothetical protein NDU88_002890 [Pleurodeles waltl]|uniref:Uncharacterized protein n=1 Tax=Pleurodeles waltl TaxID=8319 RepID=A0AAV7KU21_PLEWA|nr:hypothetical protein NDU88_002890 [Pleurodeles waltl]
MTAIDVPPPHKGGQSDAEDVATLQKQATGSQMEQREQREGAQGARSLLQVERRPVGLRDNETIQGDKFFSLSDHSSWSSNEQLDLEADKTSSEFESEVSSLALGKELQESGRSATVRKKQRKRSEQVGPNKHSTNPLDTKGLQGLQWEYSKDDLTLFDNGEKQPNPVSLETIYQSIMEHREESKLESRRTQMACRKMQIQIRRVAKTCSEFTTRMEEAETRISRLEDEAGARQSSREMARQAIYDRARPNARSKAKGCEFFVRPDYCHITVEKRWRLRQLIQPLQSKGAQVFLLNPAKLKVVMENRTYFFTTEEKARAFLGGLNGPVP